MAGQKTLQKNHSSLALLNMLLQAQFAPWFGKEIMPSRPEEKCSEPPSHLTLNQELLEVIIALMLAEIFAMVQMLLNQLTMKLLYGSSLRNFAHGKTTLTLGYMRDHYNIQNNQT